MGMMNSSVEIIGDGYFLLEDGQSPQMVSEIVYNHSSHYAILLKANDPDAWYAGNHVVVPNKKGRRTVVREGESMVEIIKRLYPFQPPHLYIERFYRWNGNQDASALEGQMVFIPEH